MTLCGEQIIVVTDTAFLHAISTQICRGMFRLDQLNTIIC